LDYEITKHDGLLTNVRVGLIDDWDAESALHVWPWSFDGQSGRGLLFVQGRPPKCHRCGDRTHKVAQCTAQRSYASATLGVADDENGDDVASDNEPEPEEKERCSLSDERAPPTTPSASANVQSTSWAEQVAAERTGELAAEDGVSDRTQSRRSPQSTASGGGGGAYGGAGDTSGIEVSAAACSQETFLKPSKTFHLPWYTTVRKDREDGT